LIATFNFFILFPILTVLLSSVCMAFPHDVFADILQANTSFIDTFRHSELTGTARKGLAIVTCMDSRISPLAVVGMQAGDAKILRNAGARVTEDVLRTLVLASYLLGVNRVLVMPHTDCRMAISDEASIHTTIREQFGVDTSSLEFRTVADQRAALAEDVARIRSYPLLQKGVSVAGAIYNVSTGQLEPVDC
jgi:carbonic anhydrase